MRLVRVFRVLKLGGRYGKMQVVVKAVQESMDMLVMMMFLLTLCIIIFSAYVASPSPHGLRAAGCSAGGPCCQANATKNRSPHTPSHFFRSSLASTPSLQLEYRRHTARVRPGSRIGATCH
jgi:hypothetical protein